MLVLTLLCQWNPGWLVARFTSDPEVIAVGTQFLQVISWNFVASGLIFTCSGIFQGLGHTWPALAQHRLAHPDLRAAGDLARRRCRASSSITSGTCRSRASRLQAIISLLLLHRVMRAKLDGA